MCLGILSWHTQRAFGTIDSYVGKATNDLVYGGQPGRRGYCIRKISDMPQKLATGVYICIHVCVFTCVCVYVCIHLCVFTCVCTYVYIHLYVCMHVDVYLFILCVYGLSLADVIVASS